MMGYVRLAIETSGCDLGSFRVLTGFLERLKGLLGTNSSADQIVLMRCSSIHTFGMTYPIDVAFLDEHGWVLMAIRALRPQKITRCPDAFCVLERPSSRTRWLTPTERVRIVALDPTPTFELRISKQKENHYGNARSKAA